MSLGILGKHAKACGVLVIFQTKEEVDGNSLKAMVTTALEICVIFSTGVVCCVRFLLLVTKEPWMLLETSSLSITDDAHHH